MDGAKRRAKTAGGRSGAARDAPPVRAVVADSSPWWQLSPLTSPKEPSPYLSAGSRRVLSAVLRSRGRHREYRLLQGGGHNSPNERRLPVVVTVGAVKELSNGVGE